MITVVVASHNARTSIPDCLSALLAQQSDAEAEIVLVDNSTDGTLQLVRREFPSIRILPAAASALVPNLWEIGIRESRGDIVALTTAHCVPQRDWLRRIRESHQDTAVAVGGAIENDPHAGMVDWAVYFCRYSRYMLPFPSGFVSEIPGDNASYKRAAIERFPQSWTGGFWEPAVHAELRRAGFPLLLSPSIVVHQRRSYAFWGFMRQRFQHGTQYGRWLSTHLGPGGRVLRIMLTPAVPLVLLFRIAGEVRRKGRHGDKLLMSLPILVAFLLSWAAGELVGYVRGPVA
ncbi:MAG: glycosyltransferase [bacterium]